MLLLYSVGQLAAKSPHTRTGRVSKEKIKTSLEWPTGFVTCLPKWCALSLLFYLNVGCQCQIATIGPPKCMTKDIIQIDIKEQIYIESLMTLFSQVCNISPVLLCVLIQGYFATFLENRDISSKLYWHDSLFCLSFTFENFEKHFVGFRLHIFNCN